MTTDEEITDEQTTDEDGQMTLEFSRDDDRSRYLAVEDGHQVGLIDFHRTTEMVAIDHTETNPEVRGRGIADRLTRFAVDDIRAQDLLVIPNCPFTKAWFDDHPDDQDILGVV